MSSPSSRWSCPSFCQENSFLCEWQEQKASLFQGLSKGRKTVYVLEEISRLPFTFDPKNCWCRIRKPFSSSRRGVWSNFMLFGDRLSAKAKDQSQTRTRVGPSLTPSLPASLPQHCPWGLSGGKVQRATASSLLANTARGGLAQTHRNLWQHGS